MVKKFKLAPIMALLLISTACQDANLSKVADGLNQAAQTVAIIQTTVIEAERTNLVTTNQARDILLVCVKVNEGGRQAVAITRQINSLDPSTRTSLLAVLNPVISSVNTLVANGTINISNQETKQKIQLLLLSLQTTLNAVHLTISTGGN